MGLTARGCLQALTPNVKVASVLSSNFCEPSLQSLLCHSRSMHLQHMLHGSPAGPCRALQMVISSMQPPDSESWHADSLVNLFAGFVIPRPQVPGWCAPRCCGVGNLWQQQQQLLLACC